MSMNPATQTANYYQVLGASPMDSLDTIEDLFRQLAYEAERSGDHSNIPQIVEAFKVLRDPATREHYNQSIHIATPNEALHLAAATAQPQQPVSPQPQQPVSPQPQQPVAPQLQQPQQAVHQQPAPQQYSQQPVAQPSINTPAVSAPDPQPPAEAARTTHETAQMPPTAPQPVAEFTAAAEPVPAPQPVVDVAAAAEPVAPVQPPVESVAAVEAQPAAAEEGEVFCATTGATRRRELLAMFYRRRRELPKDAGLAIGGLDRKVDYDYEELEFHLWYMLEKKWLFREESGMLSINYKGVEQHEENQLAGLI